MQKLTNSYKIFFILAFSLLYHSSRAQLTTSTAMTPVQLVENVLVGSGVAVSNITYTGNLNAIGSFNGVNTNVGLNSGIILTTGTVLNTTGALGGAQGPHGPNNTGSAGIDNGAAGYAPLTTIAGESTFNAAVLEFDFIPNSDTVKFRYVFGSEEYPEFVNAGFNDVFAFFISGPGFGGDYNMATIPGGGGPVTIDNVNDGSNATYYVNNGNGSTSPQNGSNFYIQYDGFTVVLEAVAKVECGETYHLKIAIADVGDGAYDSGIFLEANSLSSYAPIQISSVLQNNYFNNQNLLAEGCEKATVTVTRNASIAGDALTIPITVGGTATLGVDYSNTIPSSITFNPGQTSISFSFDVFADGITEGDETVIIILNHPDPCGNDNFITKTFTIKNINDLNIVLNDKDVFCPGDQTQMKPLVSGGIPPYTYSWNTGETTDNIIVSPLTTTDYTVTVNDVCLQVPKSATGTVNVPVLPPLVIFSSNDTAVLCPNTPVFFAAEGSGGQGTYTYAWFVGSTPVGTGPVINVSPMVTTTYTIKVTDGCNQVEEKNIILTVITPVLTTQTIEDQLICPGDSIEIWAQGYGGLGDFTYEWQHNLDTNRVITVNPFQTTTYTVHVMDGCATYHIPDQVLVKVIHPIANFGIISTLNMENTLVSFENYSIGGVSWIWDLGNGQNSTMNAPSTTYPSSGWYEVELIAINEIGCRDTIVKPIYIKPEFYFYAPNAFTPFDGGRYNNKYSVSLIGAVEFDFMIFNRWGELIYRTNDVYFEWDGTYNGSACLDDVYVYRTIIVDREGETHEITGTITLLK